MGDWALGLWGLSGVQWHLTVPQLHSYVSSLVAVKSHDEIYRQQEIIVLFCETVERWGHGVLGRAWGILLASPQPNCKAVCPPEPCAWAT